MSTRHADIIIVGGGLVGAVQAIALAKSPRAIVMMDAKSYQPLTHSRPISLTYTSMLFFKKIGLWDALQSHAEPIERLHASYRGHFGSTEITAQDMQLPALGYVIDLIDLHRVLHLTLQQQQNLQLLESTTVIQHRYVGNEIELTTSQSVWQTPLVIAADGQASPLRQALGITYKKMPSKMAITATLSATPHHCAFQRFTEDGAIALLPLAHNRYGLVWSGTDAHGLMSQSDDEFMQTLQTQLGSRVGALSNVSARQATPLETGYALQQICPNVVLLGNAAHSLHPITAQGFNLSVSDIAALTDIISQNKPLSDYIKLQSKHQERLWCGTQALLAISRYKNPCANSLRTLGLVLFDLLPGVKQSFVKTIMQLGQNVLRERTP